MRVERLALTNFRSFAAAEFELHPDVTIVVGPNASGKTNLLESLYTLAVTKSFRAPDRDLVRHGEDTFRVVAQCGETEYTLGFSTAGGAAVKKITHDGTAKALIAHSGLMQVILFDPTDLGLLAGPPDGRRRYLDFLLGQTDRAYLRTLQQYRRVLKQRNALLSSELGPAAVREQIFAWDVKLAELAVAIYEQRQELMAVLNSAVPDLYRDIAGVREAVVFSYRPTVTGDYAGEFLEALARNLPRDLGAGFTTVGPHREDFAAEFKHNDIMAVASRGEVRTVVLAMKLAELQYAQGQTGVRPVLLLDDVFSELDEMRRRYLVEQLSGHQTLITTTNADAVTRELAADHGTITMAGAEVARD